jgi:hypothetical protein
LDDRLPLESVITIDRNTQIVAAIAIWYYREKLD